MDNSTHEGSVEEVPLQHTASARGVLPSEHHEMWNCGTAPSPRRRRTIAMPRQLIIDQTVDLAGALYGHRIPVGAGDRMAGLPES